MAQRLRICEITPHTSNWTCKIQVMNKCRPRISKDKKLSFMNMIFQDEQEQQIKATIYGENIPKFVKKYKFEMYHSYFITGARVQPSDLKFGRPIHEYEWVIDIKTIIDPLKENDPDENVLPLPTKLTLTSFTDIKAITDKKAELDILAIVVNCFPPRCVSMERKLQELIVIDPLKEPFTFTIWEQDIIEDEGQKLLIEFKKYPVILARRVTVSEFNGKSLQTKFNTTIQINPPYPQCQRIHEWVMENSQMLASYTTRSTSRSRSGPVISVPVDEEIVLIANAQSQQDGDTFSIEAKISIPSNQETFYILLCSNCGQEVRMPVVREIDCMMCNKTAILTPRCRFDVDLEDASGSTVGIVMGTDAENILSLTAAEVYEIVSTKKQPLPLQEIQSRLSDKVFKIQAKKSMARNSETTTKLFVISCVEKLNSQPLIDVAEGSNRKKGRLLLCNKEAEFQHEQVGSPKMKKSMEPTTPLKKK